jgi:hypothetical protein
MARTKGSIQEQVTPPEEVLLSEKERVTMLADLMFEIIADQLASEDSHA